VTPYVEVTFHVRVYTPGAVAVIEVVGEFILEKLIPAVGDH
jgi:xanthosine utilization system XapX-like protein